MWDGKKHRDRLADSSFAGERLLLLCLLGVSGGGEGGKSHYGDFHGTDGLQMYR